MIVKLKTRGCCDQLLKALIKEFDKPKAWKTQTLLIKAISNSQCISLLPNLYQFLDRKFESSILYKEIGFAIVMLENSEERIIDFLYKSITKDNELQISGACAGILCKKLITPTIEKNTPWYCKIHRTRRAEDYPALLYCSNSLFMAERRSP